jgi:hypothetical protein
LGNVAFGDPSGIMTILIQPMSLVKSFPTVKENDGEASDKSEVGGEGLRSATVTGVRFAVATVYDTCLVFLAVEETEERKALTAPDNETGGCSYPREDIKNLLSVSTS